MSLCAVPPEHLHFIWPQARPFIVAALDRDKAGRFAPADVLTALLRRDALLWISWDETKHEVEAAAVTEIVVYPRLRELRIWLVGGRNMRAWGRPLRDLLEQYARAHGCTLMAGAMRRGWLRIGGDGWHETGVAFERSL